MSATSAPMIVCLACGADDLSRRLGEITALAEALGGRALEHGVTGRTVAVQITVPRDKTDRFAAALSLAGATTLEPAPAFALPDFLIVLTSEPT